MLERRLGTTRTRGLHGLALGLLVGAASAGGGADGRAPPQKPPVRADERAILGTVDALQSASRRGDGAAICREIFTLRLARSIAAAAKRSCAAEVRRTLLSPDSSISIQRGVRVT